MTAWSGVFLDRDGTLNVKAPEGDYVRSAEDLTLLPGAADAVARLCAAGLPVFIVTNQRGVARRLMTADDLDAIHRRMKEQLGLVSARISAIASCTHETGECVCRKPLPGLLQQIARQFPGVDLTRSVMVGDAASDVAAGKAAGCVTIPLRAEPDDEADVTVPSLVEAVDWILSTTSDPHCR